MARFHQAGDGFVTEGERLVAETLRNLPDDWVIIANKMMPLPNGASREIDFIVIGDRLVFVLDDKGFRGRIHGTDQQWTLDDGSSVRSPINSVEQLAKTVAGRLRDRVNGFERLPGHPVESAIVLSRATTRPNLRDPRGPKRVILITDLNQTLLAWDAEGPRARYPDEDVDAGHTSVRELRPQIERFFYDLSTRPRMPSRVNDFDILESRDGPTGAKVFLARHTLSGAVRQLTMYHVGEDAALREFHLREADALRQLRATGAVPEVHDPFRWSDDYLVVPTVPPDGVSLAALPRPTDEAATLAEIQLASRSFQALDAIHRAGVIHRALNPDRLFV